MKQSRMDEIIEKTTDRILEGTRDVLTVELSLLADELMDAFVDRLRQVAKGLGVKVTDEKQKKKPARKKKSKRRPRKKSKPKASAGKTRPNQAEKLIDYLAKKKRGAKEELMNEIGATEGSFWMAVSNARKKVKPQGLAIVLHDDGKYYLEPVSVKRKTS